MNPSLPPDLRSTPRRGRAPKICGERDFRTRRGTREGSTNRQWRFGRMLRRISWPVSLWGVEHATPTGRSTSTDVRRNPSPSRHVFLALSATWPARPLSSAKFRDESPRVGDALLALTAERDQIPRWRARITNRHLLSARSIHGGHPVNQSHRLRIENCNSGKRSLDTPLPASVGMLDRAQSWVNALWFPQSETA